MWSPEFNNAAIVEYTAAIPEAKQNQQLPFHLHTFHKLIVFGLLAAINISIFLFANDARMSSASSNTKLEVKYNGTECSKYWVRSNWYGWLQFQNQILLSCS
jgi:hypothetical protein